VTLYTTDYLLTVRVSTRDGDPPPEIVLRAVLKALLRTHGVRCRAVGPGLPQDATKSPEAAAGPPGLADAPRAE
jgi:hypothetical protein